MRSYVPITRLDCLCFFQGFVHKWRHSLSWGWGLCDNFNKFLLLQSMTMVGTSFLFANSRFVVENVGANLPRITRENCMSSIRYLNLFWIQCPPLNRITLSQHISDNNNRLIKLTGVFCVLLRYKWATISDYNKQLILLSVIQISGGHCI